LDLRPPVTPAISNSEAASNAGEDDYLLLHSISSGSHTEKQGFLYHFAMLVLCVVEGIVAAKKALYNMMRGAASVPIVVRSDP
jgi:hypothetical protein